MKCLPLLEMSLTMGIKRANVEIPDLNMLYKLGRDKLSSITLNLHSFRDAVNTAIKRAPLKYRR